MNYESDQEYTKDKRRQRREYSKSNFRRSNKGRRLPRGNGSKGDGAGEEVLWREDD